jgi:hypothetical protein
MSKNVSINNDWLKWPVEWLRIVGPEEATRLSTLSWDTIVRNHKDKIVQISKRRVGMRVGDALMLNVK